MVVPPDQASAVVYNCHAMPDDGRPDDGRGAARPIFWYAPFFRVLDAVAVARDRRGPHSHRARHVVALVAFV